jgi:8-oxo-dGTP pyrophosphatase MutT (NUDIX family)
MANHQPKRGRKQVAALCFRRKKGAVEVLLITSRETKRWVIPKGWPMERLKDFNAAKIEAYEEAGVTGRVWKKPLGRFAYDKITDHRSDRLNATVYALEVSKIFSRWPEKRERKRGWYSIEDAAALVNEVGLKDIILDLEDH